MRRSHVCQTTAHDGEIFPRVTRSVYNAMSPRGKRNVRVEASKQLKKLGIDGAKKLGIDGG